MVGSRMVPGGPPPRATQGRRASRSTEQTEKGIIPTTVQGQRHGLLHLIVEKHTRAVEATASF